MGNSKASPYSFEGTKLAGKLLQKLAPAGIQEMFQNIQTTLNEIREGQTNLQQGQNELRQLMATLAHNSSAQLNNRLAMIGTDAVLEPLARDSDGEVPPWFPRTINNLRSLKGVRVNELLTFYQLPITGPVAVRRRRLALHIGISDLA
ncbi:hypothetical protein RUND412_005264 [Rhizina undulata]